MSILVDTSVWVDHFRRRHTGLVNLLLSDQALTHPMILVELACGTPPAPRQQTFYNLGLLKRTQQAGFGEVLAFIEREKLFGLGCGLVDMTLLTSTLLTPGARLWTRDKRLSALAERFGVGYTSPMS